MHCQRRCEISVSSMTVVTPFSNDCAELADDALATRSHEISACRVMNELSTRACLTLDDCAGLRVTTPAVPEPNVTPCSTLRLIASTNLSPCISPFGTNGIRSKKNLQLSG